MPGIENLKPKGTNFIMHLLKTAKDKTIFCTNVMNKEQILTINYLAYVNF